MTALTSYHLTLLSHVKVWQRLSVSSEKHSVYLTHYFFSDVLPNPKPILVAWVRNVALWIVSFCNMKDLERVWLLLDLKKMPYLLQLLSESDGAVIWKLCLERGCWTYVQWELRAGTTVALFIIMTLNIFSLA